jgi:hypothetical protein
MQYTVLEYLNTRRQYKNIDRYEEVCRSTQMFSLSKNEERPEAKHDVKYIGGHSMHPKGKDTQALFFADRLDLKNLGISIPYSKITKLGGQEDRHIAKTRVFCTGIIPGLLWKKIYRYTVINYNDGFMDQVVVLDFHKDAERVQTGLYQNMIDAKKGNE